jgi:hypothetical protein
MKRMTRDVIIARIVDGDESDVTDEEVAEAYERVSEYFGLELPSETKAAAIAKATEDARFYLGFHEEAQAIGSGVRLTTGFPREWLPRDTRNDIVPQSEIDAILEQAEKLLNSGELR